MCSILFDTFDEFLEVLTMQNSTKDCDKENKKQTVCDLKDLGDFIEFEDGTIFIDKDYMHLL